MSDVLFDIYPDLLQDREVQRIAAAFQAENLCVERSFSLPENVWNFGGTANGVFVFWEMQVDSGQVLSYKVSQGDKSCTVFVRQDGLLCRSCPYFAEQMAHGLYRLGIDEPSVLAQLDHPLTAHEQVELRLSMPREFWPQKWLDESLAHFTRS